MRKKRKKNTSGYCVHPTFRMSHALRIATSGRVWRRHVARDSSLGDKGCSARPPTRRWPGGGFCSMWVSTKLLFHNTQAHVWEVSHGLFFLSHLEPRRSRYGHRPQVDTGLDTATGLSPGPGAHWSGRWHILTAQANAPPRARDVSDLVGSATYLWDIMLCILHFKIYIYNTKDHVLCIY